MVGVQLRRLGAVLQWSCKTVLFLFSFNIRMRWMLYNDLKYVNVANEKEVHATLKYNIFCTCS